MKTVLTSLLCLFSSWLLAQAPITKEDIAVAEKFLDLTFTEPERDSMLAEVTDNLLSIKAVHSQHLDNWVAPALYFNPLPSNFKMPKGQKPILWSAPKTLMPANKADLAFYTIPTIGTIDKN